MPEYQSPYELDPNASADEYAALLEEARKIKGISLWADAWRRLRRNRVAMVSLLFLIVIGFLSLITPLLPLQSPIAQDVENKAFQSPNIEPARLTFKVAGSDSLPLTQALAEVDPATDPIGRVWNKPGPTTRFLIGVRLSLFGDWCIPSICGNDQLGRDMLSRLFWGARVSLIVGIVATLVSLVIGVTYGAVAGYLGGNVDALMMRLVDIMYSIPFIFVVIFIITILGQDENRKWLESFGIDQITIFYFIIGAIYWLTMSRVVRGQVISLRNEQFIDAARTIGASTPRVVFRHIVPNVMGVVIVYLTLTIPAVMLFEAFLSFLGLGVSPPDVSWGLLVNEGVQVITPVKHYWWLVLFPGLALSLTLFALNFLGDGLRDALDPRLKNR